MNQTVTYSVWLFLPGVALIWSSVSIRRTHRILAQVHQDAGVSRRGLLASLVEETGPKTVAVGISSQ
jgi:DNA-binding phage protein